MPHRTAIALRAFGNRWAIAVDGYVSVLLRCNENPSFHSHPNEFSP